MPNDRVGTGGLIVYTRKPSSQWNAKVEVWLNRTSRNKVIASVVQRNVDGETYYIAIFPELPSGTHSVHFSIRATDFTVFEGHQAEVDLRY
jgi:hypothetical protein